MLDVIGALLPPAGLAILFVIVIRALVLADRRERIARIREDAADEDARTQSRGAPGEAPEGESRA